MFPSLENLDHQFTTGDSSQLDETDFNFNFNFESASVALKALQPNSSPKLVAISGPDSDSNN